MTATTTLASTGFDRFGLHHTLTRGIQAAGFTDPRPIQSEAIPAALDGRDVLGLAQTGTGKTAAFALPILDRLLRRNGKGPRVLVLAPTRELATQIAEEVRTLSRFTRLSVLTVFGGVSIHGQVKALRQRPEIIVGCPGRVLDLLQQGLLRLDDVETLVLDEADHMFDMGFLPDIRKILSRVPAKRQNLLFSATMPDEIRHLADNVLRNPHVVEMAGRTPAATIDHALFPVVEGSKRKLLEHILNERDCTSAIVFTRTKHRAKRLADQLDKAGHHAVCLQGNMSQGQRDRAMRGFRSGKYDVLVATDIAARGLDVSGISHVINYDVPNTPEAYTHRIGRTGRSERDGIACTFVTREDRAWISATERRLGQPIPRRQAEGFDAGAESVETAPPRRAASRPVRAETSRTAAPAASAGAPARGRGKAGGSRRRNRRRAA